MSNSTNDLLIDRVNDAVDMVLDRAGQLLDENDLEGVRELAAKLEAVAKGGDETTHD